jgi:hypothetical protein
VVLTIQELSGIGCGKKESYRNSYQKKVQLKVEPFNTEKDIVYTFPNVYNCSIVGVKLPPLGSSVIQMLELH